MVTAAMPLVRPAPGGKQECTLVAVKALARRTHAKKLQVASGAHDPRAHCFFWSSSGTCFQDDVRR